MPKASTKRRRNRARELYAEFRRDDWNPEAAEALAREDDGEGQSWNGASVLPYWHRRPLHALTGRALRRRVAWMARNDVAPPGWCHCENATFRQVRAAARKARLA